MTCYRPRPAWRERDSSGQTVQNHNGRTPITFKKKGSHLDNDFLIPCGKCTGCNADKARDWGVRIYHESLSYEQNSFLTLTYDDDHLVDEISKVHTRQFMRKLQRLLPCRYFITGEYGEKTHRPHYHAIIFGTDFRGAAYSIDDQLYGNPFLDVLWDHGTVAVGELEGASAMYVAGYVNKKIDDPDTFSVMSKGSIKKWKEKQIGKLPPIGYRWAEANIDNMNRQRMVVVDGKTRPIPQVYFDWFPDELDFVKGSAEIKERSPEALRNREINFKHKLSKEKI